MFDSGNILLNKMNRQAGGKLSLIILWWLYFVTVAAQSAKSDDSSNSIEQAAARVERLLVMTTVQDMEDESFKRFNRSIETYKLDLSVLRWPAKPQDEDNAQRDSQLSLIRRALATYKSEPNLLIMIVDSRNIILNGNQKDIVSRFIKFDAKSRVIFAADSICWPDSSLANEFPVPAAGGQRYLDSDAYIGFAMALWNLFNSEEETGNLQTSDSQPFFTGAYLNEAIRNKLGLTLDHKAELFQNLRANSSLTLSVELEADGAKLKNSAFQSEPVVAVGKRESRVALNSLGNYLAQSWTEKNGCLYCDRDKLALPEGDELLPNVLVAAYIVQATPFLEEFFEDILQLNYPLKKIHLLVHNSVAYHDGLVRLFLEEHGSKFASQQVIESAEAEWKARDAGLKRCQELHCDYYLSLDSVARIELPDTLRILIEANRTIVAPLLNRPAKLWSNFWGAITADGFYARSHDYVELVKRDRVGLWNVPHIMNAFLMSGPFIRDNLQPGEGKRRPDELGGVRLTHRDDNSTRALKAALMFTSNLRESNVHQHMINTHEFGHLVDPTSYNISLTHPDFYQLAENVLDWERTYLHENYSRILEEEEHKLEQPCQDVFWFPLVSENFCRQLIEIMEMFGEWSGGTNHDPRIEGGYESVPTRDIHMKQVGLQEMWLLFLRDYVMPVQLKEYIGYEHDPPRANLAFVVRYHPAEQASLQAHHDSSTYTLNIALNSPGLDYLGGGCRFERYNCSVTQSRRGWALMHPGRLTHYHEGLPVTNGTRYIMVTFVDP